MANSKEIRTQINSIKSTQKITRAMELVAASKMRRAKDRMATSKPYATKIRDVISHVAAANPEYPHPYLQKRTDIKNIGIVIVSSDRGLCGGLNINLFRQLLKTIKAWRDKGVGVKLCLIGHKANLFFSRLDMEVLGVAEHLGDAPKIDDLIGVVKIMLDQFDQGHLDGVYLASNDFVNTMTQKPFVRQLLPLEAEESHYKGHWDYIYEPDASKDILTMLLVRYIESQVYQAVIENIACFQASQMVAMKSATENASELIGELQTIYNKVRQAGITREIAEIVSGAAAIE